MPNVSTPLFDRARRHSPLVAMVRRLVLVSLIAGVAVPGLAQGARPANGGKSPQAVVTAMQQAATANDWGAAFALLLPSRRHELAEPLVESVLLMVVMTDPDSLLAGPLSSAEKAKRRAAHAATVSALRSAWRPFGLEGVVGRPPLAPETRDAVAAALPAADLVLMMRDTMAVFDDAAAALGIPDDERPRVPSVGPVTGLTVRGDRATANEGKARVDFARVDGRWYLAPTKAK